jgi:hypothetical protein
MDSGEKQRQAELRELLLQTVLEEQQERRRAKPRGVAERRRDWNVVRRFQALFEASGAFVLGLVISSIVILLIFVLTRMIFHIDLSKYFPI